VTTIRPIERADEPRVRELATLCHPGYPAPPVGWWYFALPTIVAETDLVRWDQPSEPIVGYASFSIDHTGQSMSLDISGVDPAHRGQGIGAMLMSKRIEIGQDLGVKTWLGLGRTLHPAMGKLLQRFGFHACRHVPAGVVYVRSEVPHNCPRDILGSEELHSTNHRS
jgi:GNAT superfamily N-acetyltransferase